jgi:hypothetical protein
MLYTRELSGYVDHQHYHMFLADVKKVKPCRHRSTPLSSMDIRATFFAFGVSVIEKTLQWLQDLSIKLFLLEIGGSALVAVKSWTRHRFVEWPNDPDCRF